MQSIDPLLHNGAGKTSTFRMITGEFAPTSGDTHVLVTGGGKREYLSVHKVG